ncbi:Uncharacterised protein [Acinetobacter baumannii]|nr:Uncharacterised protein [Acinetobacter baumannii]
MQTVGAKIPAQHPLASAGATDELLLLEKVQQFLPLILGQQPTRTMQVGQAQRLSKLLALVEHPQHAEQDDQLGQRAPPPETGRREIADQHRAEQNDHPGKIDPQQEDRHGGEGTVDQLVAGKQAYVQPEQGFRGFEQYRGEHAAHQGMAHRDPGVRDRRIEQGEGRHAERQRHQPQQRLRARQRVRAMEQRQRSDVGGHGEAGPQQQWAQAEDRPVEEEPPDTAAWLANPPDLVEGFLDGHQHGEGGDCQKDHPDPGQVPGLGGETLQVGFHRFSSGGHEIAKDESLDRLAHAMECRNQRKHGKHHRHHRHYREQRGVGQRRRAVGSLVGDEAMSEEASELDPIVEMFAHALSLKSRRFFASRGGTSRRRVQSWSTRRLE